MPLTKPLLVKRILLKLVLVIDNPKSTEFGLKYIIYNKANSILALYYRTKITF
jgi:hypothetical protein